MANNVYKGGVFEINNQFLHFFGTTLNLKNIDYMKFKTYDRHSFFYGIKEWIFGLIVMMIICSIFKNIMWIGDIYIFTIVALITYNVVEHKKQFFGLIISTGVKQIELASESKDFLNEVHDAILDGMKSDSANYIINFDSHDIQNNGIISNGDKNINKVSKND